MRSHCEHVCLDSWRMAWQMVLGQGHTATAGLYILLDDKAITPAIQEMMYRNLPCGKLITVGTGHSPFLSAPGELAGHLLSL